MTWPLPDDDDRLLAELRQALRSAGPITVQDLDRAKAAFTWRTIDQELALAALVYDSSIQPGLVLRSAAGPGTRALVFEGQTASVEVEVTPDAVTGRLVPPGPATVALITADGPAGETAADEMGGFTLPTPATHTGPVRLHCRAATMNLVTDWITL